MTKVTKKQLVDATTELQRICEFEDPPLKTKGVSEEKMKEELVEAVTFLEPEDNVKPAVVKTLQALGLEVPGHAAPEPEEPEEEEQEEEKPKRGKQSKKAAPKKEAPKKAAPKKEPKAKKETPKKPKVTRLTVMRDILQKSTEVGKTEEQMVDAMVKAYGGSEKAAKFEVSLFLRFLGVLGLIEKDAKDKIKYLG